MKDNLKILCVIDNLGSGGAQRQLVGLAIAFKNKGHEVSFLTYHKEDFFRNILEENGIEVKVILEPNYLKRLLRFRRYIRKGNYDIVLSFLEGPNFICEFAGTPFKRWKLIVGERSANPRVLKSLKLKLYRWFHFFADYVVANSKANIIIVKKVSPLIPNKKLRVIYNYVEEDYFIRSNYEKEQKKADKFHLLVAASHRYLKNLNGLIEGVILLPNELKNKLKISWFGDRTDSPYFDDSINDGRNKIKANNLEHIFSFFPATNNLADEMEKADLIGLFSFFEGFPNVICEAMALGKPVIASNVSDLPEVLSHSPCQIVLPNSPENISKQLGLLINTDSRVLGKIGGKNKEIALSHFKIEKTVEEYLKLMQ